MSLTTDLQALSENVRVSMDPETLGTIEDGMSIVARDMGALGVGDKAPDFTLPDATGATVRLADLLAEGPVVVNFYRGGWCPYCNLELRAFQAALPEITARGASLVAISPEAPDNSLSTKDKQQLEFHVLSDVGSEASRAFGVAFTLDDATRNVYAGFGLDLPTLNGAGTWELLVPGTYVIGSDGLIAYAFVEADYRLRVEPSEVLAALDSLGSTTTVAAR